jgi:hypothetical protein
MPRSVSSSRTLRCVELFCCTYTSSMFIIIIIIIIIIINASVYIFGPKTGSRILRLLTSHR